MKKIILIVSCLLAVMGLLSLSVTADAAAPATEIALESAVETASPIADCTCAKAPATRYCPECGGRNPAYRNHWACACGTEEILSPYCPSCGTRCPDEARFWTCAHCDSAGNFYDHCSACGKLRYEKDASTKFRINTASLKETLPIMGMGMLGIFIVIGIIALSVTILRKLPEKQKDEE